LPGLDSLTIDVARRKLTLVADGIEAGLPAGDGSGAVTDLIVRLVVGSGGDARVYETVVELNGSRSGWRY
jgi:hypothetical protein